MAKKKSKKKPAKTLIEHVSAKGLPARVMQRLADKINEIVDRLNE
jgi:hypothetical protein